MISPSCPFSLRQEARSHTHTDMYKAAGDKCFFLVSEGGGGSGSSVCVGTNGAWLQDINSP